MIKGADRKDSSRIIQLRATSEYHCMINLVINLLNEKIAEVGGKEKITSTDVIKLAIQALATGDNSFNILGNRICINELVSKKLDEFKNDYSKIIPKKAIEFEVKYFLVNKIKEIINGLIQLQMDNGSRQTYNQEEELKILEASVFSRESAFESMRVTEEEREALGLVKIEDINYYLDFIIEYKERLNIEEINYVKLKEEVENNILKYVNIANLPALKLYDNYRYSFILTALRKDIDKFIEYIKNYIEEKDNPFLSIKNKDKSYMEYDYDLDDYDYNDDSDYCIKDEYNLSPDDPDYEFSISEALDNMYGK